jgi:spoIIIJ-associated protein
MSQSNDETELDDTLDMNDDELDEDEDGDFADDEDDGDGDGDTDDGDYSEAGDDGQSNGQKDHAPNGSANGSRERRRRPPEPDYEGDDRARQAMAFVADIVKEMEMECRVRLRRPREENSEDEINIEISGKDAGRIIGKKGQVLQALQFLTHRVVNRPGQDRRPILVDAEGYRSRRDNSLASMARRLGKQAVEEGKIITFEPMNPRDRRVVHLALAKFEGVITKSDGEGDDRRVQIIPVRR